MKTVFKKLTVLACVLLALIIAFAAGCTGAGGYDGGIFAPSGSGSAGGDYEHGESGSLGDTSEPDGSGESDGKPDGSQTVISKQLTAAEWRDALNYDFWLNLFEREISDEQSFVGNGIFYSYAKAPRGLDTFDMHEVSVTCDRTPVVNAQVKLYNESEVVYSAVTDSTGKAYVFGEGTRIEAVSGEITASESIADGVTNIALTQYATAENELEIMLVVDTTGSMGDELSFLCNELAGVITRVSSALDCNIRLGLLFYRDYNDAYVTRKFDFVSVTSSDGLNTVVKNIKAQKSDGGGDYEEAVDKALSEAVAANWHTNSKTRLLFHVLDAPYHDNEQKAQSTFAGAVKSAAEKGIRIIPVAASGLDTLGQYIMRSAALLSGGTYTFLTDDSGIGNSHELPAVGEFTVEYLSDLMVRLIKGYYTGTFDEPVPWFESDSIL